MKDVINMNIVYRAPKVKVVEIDTRCVLCESIPGTGGTGIESIEGEETLEW